MNHRSSYRRCPLLKKGGFLIFAIRSFPFDERCARNVKITRGRGRDGLRRLEIFLSFNIDTRLGRDGSVHRAALMRSGCKRELACYLTKKDATDSGA